MQYLVPLWRHQLDTLERARKEVNLALFHEMGTGKSATTINICREHFAREKRLMRTLVLGPLITLGNWKKEWHAHSKLINPDVVPLYGSNKKRLQTVDEVCTAPEGTLTRGRVLILNYEALESDDLHEKLRLWAPEILICDESQRLKNAKSIRAKRVAGLLNEERIPGTKKYRRKVRHCYILSGLPILNSPMDIFFQYRILDSGETFGLNFFEFRSRYFQDLNAGMPSQKHFPNYVARPETYEVLNKRIYSKATRVLKKDCLDIPEIVRQGLEVPLGAEQERLYKEMKRDYITWITAPRQEPRAVVAQMAITKALRLQQIVSGFVNTAEGVPYVIKDNPRLAALKELLKDLTPNHKVIVWATFKENYKQIAAVCEKENIKYVELHGGILTSRKNENIALFQRDPSVKVIIANQHAAGIGVNLVEHASIVEKGRSSYSIFYSKNFSLDDDKQAESRNHRGGSEVYESVTRIDLIAPGTIDELINEALKNKQQIADLVLQWTEKL